MDDYTYYFHVVFRWFKYISDATEAYRVKSRNSKVEVVEPVQAAPLQVPEPVQATPSIQAQETATTAIQDLEKDSVTTSTTTSHQADSGDTKRDDDKEWVIFPLQTPCQLCYVNPVMFNPSKAKATFSQNMKDVEIFENYLNSVMLVFIG